LLYVCLCSGRFDDCHCVISLSVAYIDSAISIDSITVTDFSRKDSVNAGDDLPKSDKAYLAAWTAAAERKGDLDQMEDHIDDMERSVKESYEGDYPRKFNPLPRFIGPDSAKMTLPETYGTINFINGVATGYVSFGAVRCVPIGGVVQMIHNVEPATIQVHVNGTRSDADDFTIVSFDDEPATETQSEAPVVVEPPAAPPSEPEAAVEPDAVPTKRSATTSSSSKKLKKRRTEAPKNAD
jgi:hypothetical protein